MIRTASTALQPITVMDTNRFSPAVVASNPNLSLPSEEGVAFLQVELEGSDILSTKAFLLDAKYQPLHSAVDSLISVHHPN